MKPQEPTHQIKNAKGLFVESVFWPITSVAVAQHLREHALPLVQAQGKAPLAQYVKALDALQILPMFPVHHFVQFPDAIFDEQADKAHKEKIAKNEFSYRQSDRMLCYGWQTIGSAKGASNSSTATTCASAKEAGWLDIGEVSKRVVLIDDMLQAVGLDPIGDSFRLNGAANAAKKGKDLIFDPIEPTNQYAQTENFLLFVCDRGYLDDKGSTGPLSRARGFESAAAAARTARSRDLASWKIVKAAMSVIEAVEFKGDTHSDEVASAVAHAEAKSMERALENASIEKLRERLAAVEAKEVPTAEAPVAKKPRL